MEYKLIDFDCFSDKDSILVALQKDVNCPFAIKRVFYIFGVCQDTIRGEHANRHSQFLLIALSGSCKVKVDNAKKQEVFVLNNPKKGLFLGEMLWKQMYGFSKDCVLLALSDSYYDESEYLYDYKEYCTLVGGGVICRDLPLVA